MHWASDKPPMTSLPISSQDINNEEGGLEGSEGAPVEAPSPVPPRHEARSGDRGKERWGVVMCERMQQSNVLMGLLSLLYLTGINKGGIDAYIHRVYRYNHTF